MLAKPTTSRPVGTIWKEGRQWKLQGRKAILTFGSKKIAVAFWEAIKACDAGDMYRAYQIIDNANKTKD